MDKRYISLETAKLIKKIGFPQYIAPRYYKGELTSNYVVKDNEDSFSAPSVMETIEWLYNTYNIFINTSYRKTTEKFYLYVKTEEKIYYCQYLNGTDPIILLERGIRWVLENKNKFNFNS